MKYLISLFLLLKFTSLSAQEMSYNAVLQKLNSEAVLYNAERNVSIPKGAVDLTQYLPNNPNKNGTVDYTSQLQKGITENRVIIMPDFPVLVNENGLTIPSNTSIYFLKKSKIILKPSERTTYNIINIYSVKNVNIYNAVIVGDRYTRKSPDSKVGESGMGIAIRSSTNISIFNPVISNCWGDGIYFGKNNNKSNALNDKNDNVKIQSALIYNSRRNGISITNGENIFIDNPIVVNTYGKAPQSGIDIEPNSNKDVIDQIEIKNPITIQSKKTGIIIALKQLVGPLSKNVNVKILDHLDISSALGFRIAGYNNKKPEASYKKLNGLILVQSPEWRDNKQYFATENNQKLYPTLKIKSVTAKKKINNQFHIDKEYPKRLQKGTHRIGIIVEE